MLHLIATRRRLEKVVYQKGTNVALYNAEQATTYEKFKRNLYRALNRQIAAVAKNQRGMEMLLLLAKSQNTSLEKIDLKNVNMQLVTEINHLLSGYHLDDILNVSAFLSWAGEQGGKAALDKMNIVGIFNLTNPELISYFDDYSKLLVSQVDDYTKKWIALKIQEGKANGLNPNQIISSLIDDGKGISDIRATRIVLTETARAMTTVELEAARRYGIQEKIWRTSVDDRVDPICLGLEGVKVGVNQYFPGGYAGPPAHVACRCFIEEVIPSNWVLPDRIWLGQ